MTESGRAKKPLIHALYASPMSGEAIEAESFSIIDREADRGRFSPEEWEIVRRMIHTTADLRLCEEVRFSPDAIKSGAAALRAGRAIYVDSNMIRSGISLARLRGACPRYRAEDVVCHVADEDVAEEARKAGLPRSLFAVRKARPILDGGLVAVGNAPVALLELNRMIAEEAVRPALVIAMPVGFVHVVESKEELMASGTPYIALAGRRGGSPLAVSVVHALCALAG